MSNWSIQDAQALYNTHHWGDDYFNINEAGHVTVAPNNSTKQPIDLYQISHEIRNQGLNLPVLLRITNILSDRVNKLCGAFDAAIKEHQYEGKYFPVYPIKVNQQRTVVDHILDADRSRVGLESGSKPELMVVLSHANAQGGVIVCNGYKDREYIRLALIGQKLGHKVFIVIEKISELNLILEEARELDVTPMLGVRVRLASIGKGKWQNTGGEKSKFGLSAHQLLEVINHLRDNDALHCLQLLHCHLGSQLANIRDIQRGFSEFARYFSEVTKLGAYITHLDVGGGLGVDYEGSRSRNFCSMNYSINEYANDIVKAFWQICNEENIPHPHIITESGRAMTAHHAVLITNIVDLEKPQNELTIAKKAENQPMVLSNLWDTLDRISDRSVLEVYHDAVHWLAEAQSMYTHGLLNLEERAQAEQLYFSICHKLKNYLSTSAKSHREIIDELNNKLAYKYFVNLSIFQSLPDIWAIDQIFPILPLHRLNEEPNCRVTLQDLTCDSDGAIKHYVNGDSLEATLPMHELKPNEEYLIGIFLVGAYQEILGDMHNLFGDTHSINLEVQSDGTYQLLEPEEGDKIEEILSYVHFNADEIRLNYENKLRSSDINPDQQAELLNELISGLSGYSYFED